MIDLQIHTTDSDGTWSWDQVLDHCLEMGLSAFAITDHDTILRRDQILKWAQEHNTMAIPGIELSAHDANETVHLLGYFLDGPLDKIEKKLKVLGEARIARNKKIVAKLNQLGFAVSEEEVYRISGEGTVTRPHVARLLLNKKYVKTMKEAFDRFLQRGAAAYFPKEEVSVQEALDLLKGAGAVTSVAHPGLLKRTPERLENSLKQWAAWGLDGVEVYYPVYRPAQTAFLSRMAIKYQLIETGGSDFHGDNRPKIKIGTGFGRFHVPDELLQPLLGRRRPKIDQSH